MYSSSNESRKPHGGRLSFKTQLNYKQKHFKSETATFTGGSSFIKSSKFRSKMKLINNLKLIIYKSREVAILSNRIPYFT